VVDSTDSLMDEWASRSPVDACREMRRVTLKIIIRTLFSAYDEQQAEKIRLAVEEVQHWAKRELHRVVATPRWLPLVGQPKARRAIATLRKYVRSLVLARKSQTGGAGDVLDKLLHTSTRGPDGPAVSGNQLCDELVTLLLAGHETSAAALTWTIWHLAHEVQVQEELAESVQVAVGNRRLELADLPRLSGVAQAVSEAMRLHPPVYLISREVAASVKIAGYELCPGSQVFINLWVTHRDPRWFPTPLKFVPNRFLPKAVSMRPKCSFFPFGAGPRACLGRDFAMIETTLIAAALLQRFQFRPAAGQLEPELEWQLTLHPRGALLIDFIPRGP
ncbi:MAG: cytochrome P450, partial [Planctomycetales bacterium]|nr:cytochrome P450 [Planctomycetales bacterium]